MKKSKVDPKMRKSRSARNKDYRFFLLAGVFLAVCIVFTVFFAINQMFVLYVIKKRMHLIVLYKYTIDIHYKM